MHDRVDGVRDHGLTSGTAYTVAVTVTNAQDAQPAGVSAPFTRRLRRCRRGQ